MSDALSGTPRLTVEALAERLGGKRHGGGWSARCPAHDDGRASLSLGHGKGGRILLKCHAGCSLEAILGALGLEARDLFTEPTDTAKSGATREVVAAYDYRDEEGALLYQVVRYRPKDFRQRCPDGAGGWRWGLNGARRVMYRLPELLARAEGAPVWIVEGEKDADTLAVFGLAATCNPMGAGKWEASYRETFRGADVLVVPDNDGPGQRHAAAVAASLEGVAASVRVVTLPRGKDVSEYLASGGTVDALQGLARDAASFQPAPAASLSASPPEGAEEGDDVLPDPQRLADVRPEPLEQVVDGLLLAKEINLAAGDGDAGKSTAIYHMAGAVAVGAPVFGSLRVRKPGPVLLVTGGEDSAALARNRMEAFAVGQGWDTAAVLNRVHVYDAGLNLDDPRWILKLGSVVLTLGVVLVTLDPLADLIGDEANEDDSRDARRITRHIREIIQRTGTTFLLAHHVTKASEGKTRRERIRGSGSWTNAARLVWWVERSDGGMILEAVKANRLGRRPVYRVARTVTTEADGLTWRAAHLALDTTGNVAGEDVVALLALLGEAATPPTSRGVRDLFRGRHVSNERADRALHEAEHRGWASAAPGGRNAKLWALTDAGRARLLLSSGGQCA